MSMMWLLSCQWCHDTPDYFQYFVQLLNCSIIVRTARDADARFNCQRQPPHHFKLPPHHFKLPPHCPPWKNNLWHAPPRTARHLNSILCRGRFCLQGCDEWVGTCYGVGFGGDRGESLQGGVSWWRTWASCNNFSNREQACRTDENNNQ